MALNEITGSDMQSLILLSMNHLFDFFSQNVSHLLAVLRA